jgi:DNA-binding CsgD family transcriptional regulator
VWEHTRAAGADDPGAFPVAGELVEALGELGQGEEALEVTARLAALAADQDHPWAEVTARRCRALARPDDADAQVQLAAAADGYAALGLHPEHARTLLALGRAARRLRRWGAARDALERAAAAFDALDSPGWAALARAELDRVGARRPRPPGELTPAERRVVELAAAGRSNKEIAHALTITINTVEAHLSHAYAKLGVSSRGQLAGRLARA